MDWDKMSNLYRGPSIDASFQISVQLAEAGADPGFQVRGGALKKSRRAEGGAKIVGVFRVKNHDLTTKNHIFSNCGGRRENCWGISCEKSRFYAKKSFFSNLGGARAGCAPPPPPPPGSAPVRGFRGIYL